MRTKSYLYFLGSLILVLVAPNFLVLGIPDANVFDFFLAFFVMFFCYLLLSLGISNFLD